MPGVIGPVVRSGSRWRRQQADLLVIADRLDLGAGRPGQFSDRHIVDIRSLSNAVSAPASLNAWSQGFDDPAVGDGVAATGIDQRIQLAGQRRQVGNLAGDRIAVLVGDDVDS
nr:hypothetical protein [Tanacetum cinerariifolium]